ncbi:hypothetical protein JB92DRAFT_3126183 [Gautieria morchelliformis]|nr:hypothetical protein JB92DRAFT_3126183 [Gautieria morchelliformis]
MVSHAIHEPGSRRVVVKIYRIFVNTLPSLVIKVAARRRSDDLAREAWFYEEMEDIQGVAIAHCYGFFTAEIEQNSEVLDWAKSDADCDEEVDVRGEASPSEDDGDTDDTWDLYAWTDSDDLVMEEFSWEAVFKRNDERRKLLGAFMLLHQNQA